MTEVEKVAAKLGGTWGKMDSRQLARAVLEASGKIGDLEKKIEDQEKRIAKIEEQR